MSNSLFFKAAPVGHPSNPFGQMYMTTALSEEHKPEEGTMSVRIHDKSGRRTFARAFVTVDGLVGVGMRSHGPSDANDMFRFLDAALVSDKDWREARVTFLAEPDPEDEIAVVEA
jgi:hypothetical protein